jgi:hypothetical protein
MPEFNLRLLQRRKSAKQSGPRIARGRPELNSSSTGHKINDGHNKRHHQKKVDQTACDVKSPSQ